MVRRGFTFEMALQEFFVLWLFAHEKCFVTTKRVRGGGWATLLQQKKYRFIEEQGMGREVKGKENQTKNKRGWEIQANTEKNQTFQRENLRQRRDSREGISFPAWCGTGASMLSSFLSLPSRRYGWISSLFTQVNNVYHNDHWSTVNQCYSFSQDVEAKLKRFGKNGWWCCITGPTNITSASTVSAFNLTSFVTDLHPILLNVCLTIGLNILFSDEFLIIHYVNFYKSLEIKYSSFTSPNKKEIFSFLTKLH